MLQRFLFGCEKLFVTIFIWTAKIFNHKLKNFSQLFYRGQYFFESQHKNFVMRSAMKCFKKFEAPNKMQTDFFAKEAKVLTDAK